MFRQIARQLRDSLARLSQRARQVALRSVMPGHRHMNDALQKKAFAAWRIRPGRFQNFVRLKVLAPVEQLDPFGQMRHHEEVFDFLKKLRRPAPEPLRGTPAVRRMKHYAAASGYAYEYFFEGYRDEPGARGYYFTLSADRKTWRPFSLTLPAASVEAWEQAHGRALASNERYAIAKTALFETLDRMESPALIPATLAIDPPQVESHAASLGLD